MSDRPRVKLPFGGGLDRESGVMVVEPAAFSDLRNVHLRNGKAELRGGLVINADDFTDGGATVTHIVAVAPIRSNGRGAVVGYDLATGQCYLFITDVNGANPVYATALGRTTAGGPLPRFIITDSYNKVFVAHDEPDLGLRLRTECWNMDTEAVESMTLGGVAIDFRFRGVTRYLNYVVGWGFGTVGDPDRPETLRISKPGEPNVFEETTYFLVGARGEPIHNCPMAGGRLVVRKLSDSYALNGYDLATFGVAPLDPLHGLLQSLLSVTVGAVNYFWAEGGPRSSVDGPSQDLAIPLDLEGPLPDDLAVIDLDNAFAVYDHDKREVLFVFGQWAYVLHIGDPSALRWSYRRYAQTLTAGGTLYANRLPPTGAAPEATVVFDPVTPFASKLNGSWTTNADCTGPFNTADQVEVWIREVTGPFVGVWRKVLVTLINSNTNLLVDGPYTSYPGQAIDIALRVARAGVPGPLYAATNPLSWPAGARKAAELDILSAPVHASHVWAANGGSPDTLAITLTPNATVPFNSAPQDQHITFEAEVSDGAGGWIAAAVALYPLSVVDHNLLLSDVTAFAGLTRDVRIRHHTTWVNSTWTTISAVAFL